MLARSIGKMGDLKRGIGPDVSILWYTSDDIDCLVRNVGIALLALTPVVYYLNVLPSPFVALPLLAYVGIWWFFIRQSEPLRPKDWSKEIVVITGGGSGIGALLAHQLAAKGARIAVLSITEPEYEPSKSIRVYKCDVTKPADVHSAAEKIRQETGEPTILVNNAGVVKGKLLLDLTEADVRNTFDVNAIAPFWTTKEFLPDMLLKRHGHIVNIASIMGLLDTAQMLDYNASKAAMITFNASLRNELDYRYLTPEIQTTLVLPAHIKTNMFDKTILPKEWLVPSLKPPEVSQAIIDSLQGTKLDNILRIPGYTWSTRILYRGADFAPRVLRRLSHWVSGADWAMSPYGPRPDAGERLTLKRSLQGERY